MKVFFYTFKSDSCDSFSTYEASEKPLNVYEAMKKFGWDDYDGWISMGYKEDEIPYCDFTCDEIHIESTPSNVITMFNELSDVDKEIVKKAIIDK